MVFACPGGPKELVVGAQSPIAAGGVLVPQSPVGERKWQVLTVAGGSPRRRRPVSLEGGSTVCSGLMAFLSSGKDRADCVLCLGVMVCRS